MESPTFDERAGGKPAAAILVLAATILVFPRPTGAQEDTRKSQARAHLVEGVELLKKGSASEALKRFEEAYRLFPDAKIFYNLGLAHDALGRPAEAVTALEKFLATAADAPEEARANAGQQVRRLRRENGVLRVATDIAGAAVLVDGVAYGNTPDHALILLRPGQHQVNVRSPGGALGSVSVQVAAGETRSVTVQLEPVVAARAPLTPTPAPSLPPVDSAAAPPAAAPGPPSLDPQQGSGPAPETQVTESSSGRGPHIGWRRPAIWGAAGLAVVSLGVGIVSHVRRESRYSDFNSRREPDGSIACDKSWASAGSSRLRSPSQ